MLNLSYLHSPWHKLYIIVPFYNSNFENDVLGIIGFGKTNINIHNIGVISIWRIDMNFAKIGEIFERLKWTNVTYSVWLTECVLILNCLNSQNYISLSPKLWVYDAIVV